MKTRDEALALDAADPLAPLREQFAIPPGLIYLDGNSLGVMPRSAPARVQQLVAQEWGEGLIGSWNSAGWMDLAPRIGDKIARLIGAGPGECVATDSTSVNLFKVLSAALAIARADSPRRTRIVSERSNFPTDLYIAEAIAAERGLELVLADTAEDLPALLDDRCAVLMLTHVNYRSGRMHDMAALTKAAHAAGALALWDLAHSAGAVPVDLRGSGADFAVGCGYKYLNGGPGAPAFVWVAPRHAERFWQPLAGWIGHAAPFEFTPGYRPAPGIRRYLCGTPPVLSLAALECGVDTVLAAEPFGGMAALREKSLALTRAFAERVEARCAGFGLTLASPRDGAQRGSQVCFAHPTHGYAMVQALIARGVVGDFRAGDKAHPAAAADILRFGFTPLYLRWVDVWDAVEHLGQVLQREEWREARFNRKAAVT
jgi:kynureninase